MMQNAADKGRGSGPPEALPFAPLPRPGLLKAASSHPFRWSCSELNLNRAENRDPHSQPQE